MPGVAYFFKLFTTRAVCSACTAYTSCDSIQWTLRLCQWTSTTKLKCFKVRQLGFRGEGKSRDSTPMNCWRLSLSSPDSTGTVAYPEFQTLSRWGTILSPRHPRVPLRPLGTGRRPTTVVHHQAECQPVSSTRTPSLCLTLPDAIPCGESVVNFATTQVGQGQRLWGRRGLVAGGVAFCLTLLQCLAAEPDSYRFVLGLNSQRFFFFFFPAFCCWASNRFALFVFLFVISHLDWTWKDGSPKDAEVRVDPESELFNLLLLVFIDILSHLFTYLLCVDLLIFR